MVYRAYLRHPGQRVTDKTVTESRDVALAAFAELVGRTDLDGQPLAAVISCDNRQLAYHRFDREPGRPDYWRGRLEEIQWPE
ncbi:hypothetical protein [Azorhizophilus paspali]|uniref:hypothetical protein n=1 Tax=Azorhizophilus paspali TaxID=69963 RepID=UPI0036457125